MVKQSFGNWLVFIVLSLIWGSSFILMKRATENLTGWQIGSVRILSAGLAFLPFAIFHIRKIPARKLPLVFVSGLLGNLFPAFLFAIAIEKKINSSLAGILNSLTPLFVVVLGVLFFNVKMPARKITGVVIGFVGLVIMSLSKGPLAIHDLGFTALILLATLMYGLNVNMVSKYLKEVPGIRIATVSIALIGIPAGIVAWQQNIFPIFRYDTEARFSIGVVALLGVTGSAIATALFYMLIQKAGGLFASLVTYVIPVVAIMWGLLAHEEVTLIQLSCLALILGGVWVANRS
jgi:drug/metabolite transporter (DMT)-like permease